jgi:hypothetical protein
MAQLDSFELVAESTSIYDEQPRYRAKWEFLAPASFHHLLTSCSLLTKLSLDFVVLDQAGLDLLLAHPHIVNVTLVGIAATESRVDSPCSWEALQLSKQVDVRTVAYVPLHSLTEPVLVEALLLPADLPVHQMHSLLLAATTRMAQHRHLFRLETPSELLVTDKVWELPSGMRAVFNTGRPGWCMDAEATLSLLAAVEPLSQGHGITTLSLIFSQSYREHPACIGFGPQHLAALHRAWGSNLEQLNLHSFSLADGFFPALLSHLPGLQWLQVTELGQDAVQSGVTWRLGVLCARATRPLTIALDSDLI